jgi:hypothetical protein
MTIKAIKNKAAMIMGIAIGIFSSSNFDFFAQHLQAMQHLVQSKMGISITKMSAKTKIIPI